jgi:hypothetical protein
MATYIVLVMMTLITSEAVKFAASEAPYEATIAAAKGTTDEKINNPPNTRLNARAHGRNLIIPIPATNPTMPVTRIRRETARRATGIEKTPSRHNSYIRI